MTGDQLSEDSRFAGLFVGDSGSGKSCAAAFFPKPLFSFDLTGRGKGIIGHPLINRQPWLKDITIEKFDISKGFSGIEKKLELLQAYGNKLEYKTIHFEDFTTASDLFQKDAFKWTALLKDPKGEKNISWHKVLGNIDLPGLDEFAYEDQAFKDTCLALRSLPCHIIVSVHWVDRFDDKGNISGKRISLRPATTPKVMKYFDEVYYFERKMENRPIGGKLTEELHYYCTFRNEIARTSFLNVPNNIEWTNQDFWTKLTEFAKALKGDNENTSTR